MKFIKEIYTENTGGGCMVDFIVLKNGALVAINEEYVGVYKNRDDFFEGESIALTEIPSRQFIATWGEGYSLHTTEEHDLEWFSEDQGYDKEQELILERLNVGEVADFSCVVGVHTVKRIS